MRHRPSILIWGGNNENELAIQTGWWFEVGYSKNDMTKDYKTLYKDLMKPLVTSLDESRPFVLSSPSDGVETERYKKQYVVPAFVCSDDMIKRALGKVVLRRTPETTCTATSTSTTRR